MSKLFVYGVNAQCPRETLEDEFSKYGEVVDVYNTGKGFAFVTFADERNASEAIRGMNGQVIGKQLIIIISITLISTSDIILLSIYYIL